MMLSRLGVVNAFSDLQYFQITVGLLRHNPIISWGRSVRCHVLDSVLVRANVIKFVITLDTEVVLFQVSRAEPWTSVGLRGTDLPTPNSQKSMYNFTISPLYPWVPHPLIQPTSNCMYCSTYLLEKIQNKWTCAVQTCVAEVSTVLLSTIFKTG